MKHFNQLYRAKRAVLFGVSGLLLHLRGLGALAPGLWGGACPTQTSQASFSRRSEAAEGPVASSSGPFIGGKGGSGALNTAWK